MTKTWFSETLLNGSMVFYSTNVPKWWTNLWNKMRQYVKITAIQMTEKISHRISSWFWKLEPCIGNDKWWRNGVGNRWFFCIRHRWHVQRCCHHFIHVYRIRCDDNEPMDETILVATSPKWHRTNIDHWTFQSHHNHSRPIN